MGFVKLLLNFYVNSSIHVALAVYSLVRITESYFQLSYNENLDYFIFYATITGYNFIKYAGVAKFYHRSLTKSMRLIQVFNKLLRENILPIFVEVITLFFKAHVAHSFLKPVEPLFTPH